MATAMLKARHLNKCMKRSKLNGRRFESSNVTIKRVLFIHNPPFLFWRQYYCRVHPFVGDLYPHTPYIGDIGLRLYFLNDPE